MSDIWADVQAEIDRVTELHASPQVVQIKVTPNAIPGSIAVMDIVDDEEYERFRKRGYKQPREMFMHPDDWNRLLREMPADARREQDSSVVNSIYGIQVIHI